MGITNWFKSREKRKQKEDEEAWLRMVLARQMLEMTHSDSMIDQRKKEYALTKGKCEVKVEWTPKPESNWFYKTWQEQRERSKQASEIDDLWMENINDWQREGIKQFTDELLKEFDKLCILNVDGKCKYWRPEAFGYADDDRTAPLDKFFPEIIKELILKIKKEYGEE